MTQFYLKRDRSDAYTREEVTAELKRVAEAFSGESFSTRDFNRLSKTCNHPVVFRVFGTWERALTEVGVTYKRKFTSRRKNTDVELFNEIERIWKLLGHRPSRQEWTRQRPKHSYKALSDRFGGWVAACGSFIEYKSGQWEGAGPEPGRGRQDPVPTVSSGDSAGPKSKQLGPREVPLKVRFRILDRDA